MDPHLNEWLNLAVRWLHVITGIAWIGASFYFNWLENHLNRELKLRSGIAGDLWAIHGGGFYYLEKYTLAPKEIPADLHWFKWEAYWTWLSGFMLLAIVYYFNAKALLIDKSIADITPPMAIALSLVIIFGSWFVYDFLCKSVLAKIPYALVVVGSVLIVALAYGLSHVFTARAAYIHVGAVLGTIMAANVFRVIIPSQKALVDAAKKGLKLDPNLGKNAGRRSLHNNYLTLPVVFIMISNHFPTTYSHAHSWLILVGLAAVGVLIRHYFNIRHRKPGSCWLMGVAAVLFIGLGYATKPRILAEDYGAQGAGEPVSFEQVRAVIQNRCTTCHSARPTDDTFVIAPNGMVFDKAEDILKFAERINMRAVSLRTMPLANKTGMTEEERKLLGSWYKDHGSKK